MGYKNLNAWIEGQGLHFLEGMQKLKALEAYSHQYESAYEEWLELPLQVKSEFWAFMEAGRMMFAPVKS